MGWLHRFVQIVLMAAEESNNLPSPVKAPESGTGVAIETDESSKADATPQILREQVKPIRKKMVVFTTLLISLFIFILFIIGGLLLFKNYTNFF